MIPVFQTENAPCSGFRIFACLVYWLYGTRGFTHSLEDEMAVYEKTKDPTLLNIRIFTDIQKTTVYNKQPADAMSQGVSNCPLYVLGTSSNSAKIYKQKEMDADHVAAWSRKSY